MSKEKQIEEMARVIYENTAISCVETADEIAEAVYNAGYRKQSGWISVDERLPSADEIRDEYGELVPFLVVEKDTTQPFRAFYDGFVWGDGFVKLDVTHWMPLPEPPMMKGGE
jgi:hypothetical protein